MKLWSENINGNIHQAVNAINGPKFWINWESIVHMSFTGGYNSIVVFLVTDLEHIRLTNKYHSNPYPTPKEQKNDEISF